MNSPAEYRTLQTVKRFALLTLAVALSSCHATVRPPADPRSLSTARVTTAELLRLSVGERRPEVKFIITSFGDPTQRALTLLDGHFYRLHDEWYWMNLLNGRAVPGSDTDPLSSLGLGSVAEAYAWAKTHPLPLDLAWSEDGRLYSGEFYEQCLQVERRYGLGSLVQLPRAGAEAPPRWVFQLEFVDLPRVEDLLVYFDVLQRALPPELASSLQWLTRSPEQEALARQLTARYPRLAGRTLRLRDLPAFGRVEVYSEGITAGHVRLFRDQEPEPGTTSADDLLVLSAAPGELPAAAGLITATPQTPLAHVTLLAQDRGIPNVFVAQAFDDPALAVAEANDGMAILRAQMPDRLTLEPMSAEQFQTWKALSRVAPLAAPHHDASSIPYGYELSALRLGDLESLRPFIGGKAAGFLLLNAQRAVALPIRPYVVTTRAYEEHVAPFVPVIERLLADRAFQSSAKVRYLVLEGAKRFAESHPGDKTTLPEFLVDHGAGDPLGALVRQGGLVGALRSAPIAAPTLAQLQRELASRFGDVARAGLRFRSSSTVEDLEGFNAAGLYESATGYAEAAARAEEQERSHDFEYALKKVWASYWGFVAFEERERALIDHRTGAMAVLVHPRFEDDAELANGVMTFARLPSGGSRMRVAIQKGAQSVTNPRGDAQPEVLVLEQRAPGALPELSRQQASTLSSTPLLQDAQLRALFEAGAQLAAASLEQSNRALSVAQQRHSLTLDVEFRLMAPTWRGGASGGAEPSLVLKQARSLEPEPRGMAPELLAEPIARDLLSHASRVVQDHCEAGSTAVDILSLNTNVSSLIDWGYRDTPYVAWVRVSQGGAPVVLLPADFSALSRAARPSLTPSGRSNVPKAIGQLPELHGELAADSARRVGLRRLSIESGHLALTRLDGHTETAPARCARALRFSTPEAYLLDLLGQ